MTKKIVFLTGCSRGIGFTTSSYLAEKGYIVYASVRTLTSSQELLNLAEKFSNLHVLELDVTNPKSIHLATTEVLRKEGKIDVLINNAAQILFGPIETLSIEQMKEQFDVNLFGAMAVTQAFLPCMRRNKNGRIIFLGSTSGVACSSMYGCYASTKYALEAMAHALAVTVAKWGIKVSMVENSATLTQLAKRSLEMGTRFSEEENPYSVLIKNSLRFLQNVIARGHSPATVAEVIEKSIRDDKPNFRYFVSKYAQDVFSQQLHDPSGENLLAKDIALSKEWLEE